MSERSAAGFEACLQFWTAFVYGLGISNGAVLLKDGLG
jgi:hypothetical protein